METNLGRIIQERGLKKTWVAQQANVSYAAFSSLLNGKSEPTLRTARKIARVLNISVDDIWPEDPKEE